ncbi:DNA alkylation repair protein [Yinghuangia sp. YIM S09857]|uniref:DNA alkylation repair protein n=1 Tax=Yinghuangia sp. YIM S09857 TaxID=3436929 RepID=UPI003F52FB90
MAQPLKDMINAQSVATLADGIAAARAAFPRDRFVATALDGLEGLELKSRVRHVARALHTTLDLPFPEAAPVLREAAAHVRLDMWSGWPATDYIAEYGVAHLDEAMATIAVITPYATGEFAVRPYLDRYRETALATMRGWADSDDEHLRRLASEGTRPRLPWGTRVRWLMDATGPTLPILDHLRDDPSEYVRRSVANHVNDIAKDDPATAVALLARWQVAGGTHTDRVLRHAVRGLLRTGHPEALTLVGAAHGTGRVDALTADPTVAVGDRLPFKVTVRADAPGALVLRYAVVRDGSRRVFHLGERLAEAEGDTFTLAKAHSFRPVTTRTEPPGPRTLEIIVNGEPRATAAFTLTP